MKTSTSPLGVGPAPSISMKSVVDVPGTMPDPVGVDNVTIVTAPFSIVKHSSSSEMCCDVKKKSSPE